ncbi:calcium:proton antiporter [Leucobacter sp. UCMA 4100]|uniref:calcium:proton antiporter n=1 Tax=Leucobacter sp. UCMA 4100 TaxID=2810534 RepID=UPI0022EA61B7|nr:calcium:proton antiporter [Leucobacter sp. UCMA 4100]MDA3145874.1 calcium:proton antiporter [Leucobacter sp. UCMA 4100]
MQHTLRNSWVRPIDLVRIGVGWGSFVVLTLCASALGSSVSSPVLWVTLAAIVAVILLCSFGVVEQAEALAHRLGDPYGSLVLTLSIVMIEVILITAVMLGPGEHETIARDSVMAVSMIITNLVVGLSLLVGGLKRGAMRVNHTGVSAYLAMLVVLIGLAFALPAVIGVDGAYTTGQEIPIIVLTIGLYAFFLVRQMGAQADDFRDPADLVTLSSQAETDRPAVSQATGEAGRDPLRVVFAQHRGEIITRFVLLVVTVLPIVLLSHDMASLLDDGLDRIGAPIALAGVIIAMIVFLPESLTSVRAALGGEAQRVSNLCHGALVSTVGLTIPAVLVVGMLTGQRVVLAESPANLVMLGLTLLLTLSTFSARKMTAMHGATHLVLFAVYGIVLLS